MDKAVIVDEDAAVRKERDRVLPHVQMIEIMLRELWAKPDSMSERALREIEPIFRRLRELRDDLRS